MILRCKEGEIQMKTVIIVGAGATLAEALPSRPQKKLTPPLDKTFFKLIHEAKPPGVNRLNKYMNDNYGIKPIYRDSEHRMEEIFNYIYSDTFSGNPPQGCLDAYWALLKMYHQAMSDTTDVPGQESEKVFKIK